MRYKIFFIDFDGVFTDNKVHIDVHGNEYVSCNRSDGIGISLLKNSGVECIIVSTEKVPLCQLRAQKLDIPCYNSVSDKEMAIKQILMAKEIDASQSVFLGNDINDLPAFKAVNLRLAVADSHYNILNAADYILSKPGGHGAVREAANFINFCNTKFS